MPNRPARCTKGELTTALRAASEVGFAIAGYEIEPSGVIRVLFGTGAQAAKPTSTLEERAEASAKARRLARSGGKNR